VPRTDARVFGRGLNNNFHLAGYSLAGKAGFRLYVLKRLFLIAETKAGYITLPDILLRNEQPERANQNIFFGKKWVQWALILILVTDISTAEPSTFEDARI